MADRPVNNIHLAISIIFYTTNSNSRVTSTNLQQYPNYMEDLNMERKYLYNIYG